MAKTFNDLNRIPKIIVIIVIILFLLFLASMIFTSCSPYRHYNQVAADGNRDQKKKDILAPVCAQEFPVKEKTTIEYREGETKIEKDTAGYASFRNTIDSFNVVAKNKNCPQLNTDSLIQTIQAKIKPEIRTRVDTFRKDVVKADSALMRVYQLQIEALTKEGMRKDVKIEQLQATADIKSKQAANRLWIIIALCAVIGIGLYFKFKGAIFGIIGNFIKK